MAKIMRKDPYELLRICNENSGRILSGKAILNIFGYHPRTDIYCTYCYHLIYNKPKNMWELGRWIMLKDYTKVSCDLNLVYKWYFDQEKIFLYNKDDFPFWMLKDYGGKY